MKPIEIVEIALVSVRRSLHSPRDVQRGDAGDLLHPGLIGEVEGNVVDLLKRFPGEDIVGLDENQNGFASLAEPLLEALLNEGVFLALERGKEAFRGRIRC